MDPKAVYRVGVSVLNVARFAMDSTRVRIALLNFFTLYEICHVFLPPWAE